MRFVVIGVLLLWLVPGAASALVCLCWNRVRRCAIGAHTSNVNQSILQYLAELRRLGRPIVLPDPRIKFWEQVRDRRILQLISIAMAMMWIGPLAIPRLMAFVRADKIRLRR